MRQIKQKQKLDMVKTHLKSCLMEIQK